jgi:hypothetical protein
MDARFELDNGVIDVKRVGVLRAVMVLGKIVGVIVAYFILWRVTDHVTRHPASDNQGSIIIALAAIVGIVICAYLLTVIE